MTRVIKLWQEEILEQEQQEQEQQEQEQQEQQVVSRDASASKNSSLFRNSIVSVGDDSHGVVKKLHIFLTQQSFKA